jgi:hypothetical protein
MLSDDPKYNVIRKPERNRIVDNTVIKSYGKFDVHNTKFNKLIKYISMLNKDYNAKIKNKSVKQKALNLVLHQQLDLYRLKVIYDNYMRFKEANDNKSKLQEMMLYLTGFRNFCGAGTDIYEQIKQDNDNPSKMFKIDSICVEHDIAFTHAKTLEDQQRADRKMIADIVDKYIIDFDKSMLGKNPKSFETWSDSVKTIGNYIMSSIEGYVSAELILKSWETVLSAGATVVSSVVRPKDTLESMKNIATSFVGVGQQVLEASRRATGQRGRQYIPPYVSSPFQYAKYFTRKTGVQLYDALGVMYQSINPNIKKFVVNAGFTTLIKDKFLASVALFGILGKAVLENVITSFYISGYPIFKNYFNDKGILIGLTQDEVSDELVKNIIDMYSNLQNEILKESNMGNIQPITESDYVNIEINENPEMLINDFKDIYMMQNENITTKFDRYIHEPPPSYNEEELIEDKTVYDEVVNNGEVASDKLINYIDTKQILLPEEVVEEVKPVEVKEVEEVEQPVKQTEKYVPYKYPVIVPSYRDKLINELLAVD